MVGKVIYPPRTIDILKRHIHSNTLDNNRFSRVSCRKEGKQIPKLPHSSLYRLIRDFPCSLMSKTYSSTLELISSMRFSASCKVASGITTWPSSRPDMSFHTIKGSLASVRRWWSSKLQSSNALQSYLPLSCTPGPPNPTLDLTEACIYSWVFFKRFDVGLPV